MRFWVKIGLFLSAYLPFFLILTIKNWFNWFVLGILIFATIYSCVWFLVISTIKKETAEPYKIADIDDKTRDTLTYLIPYIIAFIGFDLSCWQNITALIILIIIVFAVYMNSDLLYFNPLLSLFGYSIYKIKIERRSYIGEKYLQIMAISSQKMKIGDQIRVWDLSDNVFLAERMNG